MKQILVYGDSLSWGIVPGTRRRLLFVAAMARNSRDRARARTGLRCA